MCSFISLSDVERIYSDLPTFLLLSLPCPEFCLGIPETQDLRPRSVVGYLLRMYKSVAAGLRSASLWNLNALCTVAQWNSLFGAVSRAVDGVARPARPQTSFLALPGQTDRIWRSPLVLRSTILAVERRVGDAANTRSKVSRPMPRPSSLSHLFPEASSRVCINWAGVDKTSRQTTPAGSALSLSPGC